MPESVREKLAKLQVPYTERELNYLLMNDIESYSILVQPGLTKNEAVIILEKTKLMIKDETRQVIGKQHSIYIGNPIKTYFGGDNAVMYYAFSDSGGVLAAKVYHDQFKQEFEHEVKMNKALGHHENIITFLQTISFETSLKRHAILMPFHPCTAHDLVEQSWSVPTTMLKMIARDCNKALAYIHSKGYCYADLKPCNIMLMAEQGRAVLIDFGATVRMGQFITERTEYYDLGTQINEGCEMQDWIHLGATLAELAGIDLFPDPLIVLDRVEEIKKLDDGLKKVLRACLDFPQNGPVEQAFMGFSLISNLRQHTPERKWSQNTKKCRKISGWNVKQQKEILDQPKSLFKDVLMWMIFSRKSRKSSVSMFLLLT